MRISCAVPYLRRLSHRIFNNRDVISEFELEEDHRSKQLCAAISKTIAERFSDSESQSVREVEKMGENVKKRSDEIRANPKKAYRTVGELCQKASIPPVWGRFLFNIIRESKPYTCLELGTCLGISAAYQGSALKMNRKGRLISLEGDPERAQIAEENLRSLSLEDTVEVRVGRFQDILEDTLESLPKIDYALIDGHHDREATIKYFNQIKPHLADDAVVLFDDISWSKGMKKAWKHIKDDPDVKQAVDLFTMGACIVTKHAIRKKKTHKIALN